MGDSGVLTRKQIEEVIQGIERVSEYSREGPRHGVTAREAALYDKGWDDALRAVRNGIRIANPGEGD